MKQWELSGVTVDLRERPTPPSDGLTWLVRERLKILTERMPAIVWTTDADLRFTSSAGAGLAALRRVPDQAVGQSLFEYFGTTDEGFEPIAAHRRALAGESVSFELTWGGRTYHAHVEPLAGPGEARAGVIGAALDITERKEMEERLREAEARYHALVEQIPAISYVAAADEVRSPIYVSPQVERILGCSPEAWRADPRGWFDRVHPIDRDRVLLELDLCRALDGPLSVEYRLTRDDGREVWVHDEATLLRDLFGQPSQWQGIIVGISQEPGATWAR